MKRAAFILISAALVAVLLALPALAQTAPSLSYTHNDSARMTPQGGSVITGSWTVQARASHSSGVRSFQVAIEPAESGIPALPASSEVSRSYGPGAATTAEINIPWNSDTLTRYNGVYRVTAYAESHVGGTAARNVENIRVNNPPETPADVRVALEKEVPVVRWDANTEPDLLSYRIARSADGGSYSNLTTLGPSSSPSFRDTEAPKGKSLRYQVTALRKSPTAASVASEPARTSSSVTVPLPPPPPAQEGTSPGTSPGTTPGTQPTNNGTAGNSAMAQPLPPAPVAEGRGPVTAPPEVRARRDLGGFSTSLPYGEDGDVPVPVEFADDPAFGGSIDSPMEALANPTRLVQGTVHTPRFIAGSLILLIAAFHLVRVAKKLLLATDGEAFPATG